METCKTTQDFRDFSDDLLGKNHSRSSADNNAPQQPVSTAQTIRKRTKDLWDSL